MSQRVLRKNLPLFASRFWGETNKGKGYNEIVIKKGRFWWGMVVILGIIFFWRNQIWARTIVNSEADGSQTVVVEGGDEMETSKTVTNDGNVVVSNSTGEPRLETGSVMPQFEGPGEYTWYTYFSDPQNREPEYVKIFLAMLGPNAMTEKITGQVMQKRGSSNQGTEYVFTKNLTEEGQYQFYFEAKVGGIILHNPYYGGQDCAPGMCPECCGVWGGPKVLSEKLISDNKIYMFDTSKKTPVWSYDVGENWVTSVDFSADGSKLAAADNQGNLYLFEVSSNKPIWTFRADYDRQNGNTDGDRGLVDFSGGKWLAASLKGKVFLFDVNSSKPIWEDNIGMTLRGLGISDNGEYIAAGGHDTKVYLWKRDESKPVWEYQVKAEGGILGLEGSVIRAMAMTPDGKYFTAGTSCPDRTVYLFEPKNGEPIYKIKAGENFPVEDMDISDDGQYVVAVGGGGGDDLYSAILMETDKKKVGWKFNYSVNPAIATAISGDGQLVALGYILDGLIMVNRASGQPLWQLKNPGYVAEMTFTKDGKGVVLGTGTYHVIEVASDGSAIWQDWKVDNKIESVAVSDDGAWIAAGTGLERFTSIGGAQDRNTSGSGVGSLEDLGPELVKIAVGSKLKSGMKVEEATEKKQNRVWIWVVGATAGLGLLGGGVVWLIKKGKIKTKFWRSM